MLKAARTHVHNGSLNRVALVFDLDLLSTPWVGRCSGHDIIGRFSPGRLGEGNNHVGVVELSATSAEAAVVVIDGDVNVGESLAG